MATATPPTSKSAAYPAAELSKLLAPPEKEHPGAKLRRLLHEARDKGSYLHTCGAYDAYTAALMTRLGFKVVLAASGDAGLERLKQQRMVEAGGIDKSVEGQHLVIDSDHTILGQAAAKGEPVAIPNAT